MRVTTRKATHQQPKGRVVTDSNRCEELATLFEEGQDRFPLPVGNIQGTGAFGCDLLSFATEEARCQFRNSNVLNFDLVERFIEVKGRSSASGAIELKGNELTAARTHKDRYFIYRIHEDLPATEWKVVILRNPLQYEWPVSYIVNPFANAQTEYWEVEAAEQEPNT